MNFTPEITRFLSLTAPRNGYPYAGEWRGSALYPNDAGSLLLAATAYEIKLACENLDDLE